MSRLSSAATNDEIMTMRVEASRLLARSSGFRHSSVYSTFVIHRGARPLPVHAMPVRSIAPASLSQFVRPKPRVVARKRMHTLGLFRQQEKLPGSRIETSAHE